MRIVSRLLALSRSIQLNRQFREIHKEIDSMPLAARRQLASLAVKEFANASQCEYPHLYGTPTEQQPTQQTPDSLGKGVEVGFTRVRSDNPHIKLRGIALWLTVAYFETKDSEYGEAQNLHKQLMRTLRVLKEYAPPATAQDRWSAEIGRAVA
jgi:hypothetical protein